MAAFDPDAYLAQQSFDPDAYLKTPAAKGESKPETPVTFKDVVKKALTIGPLGTLFSSNVQGGSIRGAGSLGATVRDVTDIVSGNDWSLDSSRARRQTIDDGLTTLIGSDPNSAAYQGSKLLTEVAGVGGVGGALGAGLKAVVPSATGAINALTTSGMRAGATPGAVNMLTRMGGGAITGGTAAGLINPEDAKLGAIVGGALPLTMGAVKAGGNYLGRVIAGPEVSADTVQAVMAARDAGYVIPPSQAKPTLSNRLLEGFSGKITTAQNASAKNAKVTDSLAAKALGLPADTKITADVLTDVRKSAGTAYDAIGEAGTITPGKTYQAALDRIAAPHLTASSGFPNAKPSPVVDLVESMRSNQFDASAAVAKIKELRSAADDAFRTGNTDVGRASRSIAKAIEDAVEEHLKQSGNVAMLDNFRAARELIAKSYSVEKALNTTTGTVDAVKLGAQLKKGKPLSAELRQAGEFANKFPKAAQTVEKMGSLPQTSPLDWAAASALGLATQNPLALAGVLGRPAARALSLSGPVQNRLAVPAGQNQLMKMIYGPEIEQLIYRTAPASTAR